ncbi:MAG TPA: FAD-dependent oxidoreductase [Steroidobacteraceae bacterium]|nr:FAD-dependent oxidoreductase [Steroidobacteraceae bacterium]
MGESVSEQEAHSLGLDTRITRRDFVNGSLVAAGAALAGTPRISVGSSDTFTGYGGVGDYANANGNTWPVVQAAHRLRDGGYDAAALAHAQEEGEVELLVVGGGIAGLSAAYYFRKSTHGKRVLVLENHPVPGGEARQNEFLVDGERLLGPQGSNDFAVPVRGSGSATDEFFGEFALPREYRWQTWDPTLKPLRFASDNYSNMDGFQEKQIDVGYYFDQAQGASGPHWLKNIWSNDLQATPFSAAARRDLLRWRADHGPVSEAESRRLDTLTYKDYLEKDRGYDPAVTRFVEPIVGLLGGVSADAACARLGRQLVESPDRPLALSYPGGNSVFARALLRGLLPAALPGTDFSSLMYGRIHFAALEDRSQQMRMRLSATAIRVEHQGGDPGRGRVEVTYEQGGKLYRVRARSVVMASGGWVNRHLLVDMPEDLRAAYEQFAYAPALIVNVALRQWRFLYDMGVTACRWFDAEGFGYCCNIRRNMVSEGQAPKLHPDRPVVLSFYMGLPVPGLPAAQQGIAARTKFLATPYRDYEVRIRRHMSRLFGASGFKPDRDIAAIVLNRWGHARLIEPPGFHYGQNGRASPLERVREGYGRIAIGHSELNGAQHWGSAMEYGKKAGEKVASI